MKMNNIIINNVKKVYFNNALNARLLAFNAFPKGRIVII